MEYKMSNKKKVLRTDQAVVLAVCSVVLGFILGMTAYHLVIGTSSAPTSQAASFGASSQPASSPPPGTLSPPTAALPNFSEQIRETERIVELDPTNHNAWVALGNFNFDSGRFPEAIKAYDKALELAPDNPNVMTDRGIMHRRLGNFMAAVADFSKASQIDTTHTQSSYNLGLTLLHDLQDNQGALEAWEELMRRNPDPAMAEQVNQYLEALRNMVKNDGAPAETK
jgi:cytochrome c-type biogenesis protein CcmH/NrfG